MPYGGGHVEFDPVSSPGRSIPSVSLLDSVTFFFCEDCHLVLDRLMLVLSTEPLICSCTCSGASEDKVRKSPEKNG
jgi:hypothetical protein